MDKKKHEIKCFISNDIRLKWKWGANDRMEKFKPYLSYINIYLT